MTQGLRGPGNRVGGGSVAPSPVGRPRQRGTNMRTLIVISTLSTANTFTTALRIPPPICAG